MQFHCFLRLGEADPGSALFCCEIRLENPITYANRHPRTIIGHGDFAVPTTQGYDRFDYPFALNPGHCLNCVIDNVEQGLFDQPPIRTNRERHDWLHKLKIHACLGGCRTHGFQHFRTDFDRVEFTDLEFRRTVQVKKSAHYPVQTLHFVADEVNLRLGLGDVVRYSHAKRFQTKGNSVQRILDFVCYPARQTAEIGPHLVGIPTLTLNLLAEQTQFVFDRSHFPVDLPNRQAKRVAGPQSVDRRTNLYYLAESALRSHTCKDRGGKQGEKGETRRTLDVREDLVPEQGVGNEGLDLKNRLHLFGDTELSTRFIVRL